MDIVIENEKLFMYYARVISITILYSDEKLFCTGAQRRRYVFSTLQASINERPISLSIEDYKVAMQSRDEGQETRYSTGGFKPPFFSPSLCICSHRGGKRLQVQNARLGKNNS